MTFLSKRRGQLQALEPVMITIVLVIIVGVGLLFYVKIGARQDAGDRAAISSEHDMILISQVSGMPELSCAGIDGLPKGSFCIDLEKARQFQKLMADDRARSYYNPLLGATNITIEVVDLQQEGKTTSINIYQNMKSENRAAMRAYAVAFDPITRKTYFATIILEREQ